MAQTQAGGERLAPPSGPVGLEQAWGGLVQAPWPLDSQTLHPRAQLRRANRDPGKLLYNSFNSLSKLVTNSDRLGQIGLAALL